MDYICRQITYNMKRTYFTIVLSLLYLTFFAQASSALLHAYRAGDIIHRLRFEKFGIGTKGENQIWDYSSLKSYNKDFIVEYTSDKDNGDILVEISTVQGIIMSKILRQ